MIPPTKLYQLSLSSWEAEVAKRDALSRVEEHADPSWKAAALAAVKRTAQTLPEFSMDAVIEEMSARAETTHEPRAWGAVVRAAARSGYIEATSQFVLSSRSSCHRRPIRVWRSLLYRGVTK